MDLVLTSIISMAMRCNAMYWSNGYQTKNSLLWYTNLYLSFLMLCLNAAWTSHVGLTCSMFMRDGVELPCHDSAAGLYVKTRSSEIVKVYFFLLIIIVAWKVYWYFTDQIFEVHISSWKIAPYPKFYLKAFGESNTSFLLYWFCKHTSPC